MKNLKFLALISAGILLFIFLGRIFLESDKTKIETLFTQIEKLAEYKGLLKPTEIGGRLLSLKVTLANDIQVDAIIDSGESRKVQGFDEIKNAALLGSRLVIESHIDRYGTEIKVFGDRAEAKMRIEVTGVDSVQQEFKEGFDLFCQLIKQDKVWKIFSITIQSL